jgi:hypothetical protein
MENHKTCSAGHHGICPKQGDFSVDGTGQIVEVCNKNDGKTISKYILVRQ